MPGVSDKPLKPLRARRQRKGFNVSARGDRWLARVTDPKTRGRESQTFDSKSDAEAWAEKRRAEFRLERATPTKTAFASLATEYLIDLGRRCRSPLHRKTVEQTVDTLKAGGLVDMAADNAVAIVSRIVASLKTRGRYVAQHKKASPKTRNNFLVRVNAIANWAVTRDYLVKNRFEQIEFQKVPQRDKPVFSLEEVGKLIDPRNKDHPFYQPFACMIYTGFRGGEMRHMEWDWFLWEANRIMLKMGDQATATLDEDDDDTFISKTGRERLTCLPVELKELMKPTEKSPVPVGPVFPYLRDMDRGQFQGRFNAYLRHCKVPIVKRRTPHSCRHTWTCIRLAAGENEMLVKQQAGHSDKEMTEHYAKQQDAYRDQIEAAGWKRGEMRLRDFVPR